MKVVISEPAGRQALEILRREAEVVAADGLWRDRPRLLEAVAPADALVVRNQTRVDRELLVAARRLRVVGRLGVGLDNIDVPACRERGVRLVVPRGANAVAVAEYVFAAMLAASRRVVAATASVREGRWDRDRFTGTELAGRTLGLVGVGDIGARVARRAGAFGMRVPGTDPLAPPTSFAAAELGVALVDLPRTLAESDFVSLHLPLTPETRGLIGPGELARMKRGAWLINAARGGIVREDALHRALADGWIGGAALDNVILTPHVAGLTDESRARTGAIVARDVLNVLAGRPSLNTIA